MKTLAELQKLCTEYAAVAYPDSHEIDAMSEWQIHENTGRMNALALHIADLVIESGLHKGAVLR